MAYENKGFVVPVGYMLSANRLFASWDGVSCHSSISPAVAKGDSNHASRGVHRERGGQIDYAECLSLFTHYDSPRTPRVLV